MATPTQAWSAPSPYPAAAQPAGGEELGLQTRPMGLKVHYTFDRDGQLHCMARWPHMLHVQTIPLDERTTIGVADLRICLQAVAQSSPEIVSQQETDYSVYAYDFSEPDLPLVGQGMLSRGLDSQSDPQQQQLVTGRVTRNLLAIFGNGCRETLEVKLKLTAVPRAVQRADGSGVGIANPAKSAPIPADTASEWNLFLQSNPMLGHASNVGSPSSPALAPAQLSQFNASMSEGRPMDSRSESHPPQPIRPSSIPPANALPPVSVPPASSAPNVAPAAPRPQAPGENAPSPAAPQGPEFLPQPRPSRPSSRSRSKQPTGRPRGRPRKKPLETGNTSAAEEATDGDDGPQKKRAKVTRTQYSAIAPFGAVPDSLRVAASTSGSLRAMRPVGAGCDAPAANHLQDVPRAPTPVPDGALLQLQQQRRRVLDNKARSESLTSIDQDGPSRPAMQHLSQDARSPAASIGQSPDHGYSPEDSAGDLGSSPPVPRTAAYMHSSPAPSSPVLPTMPRPPVDSGFMSGGFDDFLDDEDMPHDFPQGQMQDRTLPVPSLPVASKPSSRKNGRAQQQQQQHTNFPFQEVHPGPPELLPTKSIFNPAGKAKTLNRPLASSTQPKKPNSRSLKRSNTAPIAVTSEQEPRSQDPAVSQQNGSGLSQGSAEPYPPQEHASFSSGALGPARFAGEGTENGYLEPPKQEPEMTAALPMPVPEHPEPDPVLSLATGPLSRPPSRGPPAPNVPPSDPVVEPVLTLPCAVPSEAPCPPSDFDPPRYSKNLVKKQSIKERLESAIEKGESPPFCNNCGAIETPTWRKIWTQDHHGVPAFHEFSDKPGCVTMIEVLERDAEGQPSMYRMVKKNLGAQDDKKNWTETLLCNPCGIWLGKFKGHRPPDRWDKDAARLNQPRKKRESKGSNSRSKKARTKSDAQVNPTSEAYFTTDPIGPADLASPEENQENGTRSQQQSKAMMDDKNLNLRSSPKQRFPGSTHSRGSGTADSPIPVEDDLGSTRRLLFPSPRKDGVPKVLGELALNTVQTATKAQEAKSAAAGKENHRSRSGRPGTPVPDDLEQELFGTPPMRPSTPPPKLSVGPFKTPTRPTPNHRPITRSISRSMRSIRSIPKSPSQVFAGQLLQRTPSKTPRSSAAKSASKRRSPRNAHLHAHFALDAGDDDHQQQQQHQQAPMQFGFPFTATLHQLLSEANDFTADSSSHGLDDLALSHHLSQFGDADDGLGQHHHLGGGGAGAGAGEGGGTDHHGGDGPDGLDFGNCSFMGAELVMPSSPPLFRGGGRAGMMEQQQFGDALQGQCDQGQCQEELALWAHLGADVAVGGGGGGEGGEADGRGRRR